MKPLGRTIRLRVRLKLMTRRAPLILLAVFGAVALSAQDQQQPKDVFRLDYTLVRSESGESTERHYSVLVSDGARGSFSEGVHVQIANQSTALGVRLTARISESGGGSVGLTSDLDITEQTPPTNGPRVSISASSTSRVPLSSSVSLISLQSQDGLRRYELRLKASKAE